MLQRRGPWVVPVSAHPYYPSAAKTDSKILVAEIIEFVRTGLQKDNADYPHRQLLGFLYDGRIIRATHETSGSRLGIASLLSDDEGLLAIALKAAGTSRIDAWAEVEKIVVHGSAIAPTQLPYTERARRLLDAADRESRQLPHRQIGAEHILAALIFTADDAHRSLFNQMNLTPDHLRRKALEKANELYSPPAAPSPPPGSLLSILKTPDTPETQDDLGSLAMINANKEARRLGHNFIGTEQLLVGLLGHTTGVAAKALSAAGVDLDRTRQEIEAIIGKGQGL